MDDVKLPDDTRFRVGKNGNEKFIEALVNGEWVRVPNEKVMEVIARVKRKIEAEWN